jgi:electron transport complex protein RnfC
MLKATGAEKGIIAIEDDKHDAIRSLESKLADITDITVVAVKTKYPQGAEKMLIKRILGRQVPGGGLPSDVGVIVHNVSTVKAIADAVIKGMPLIERVVTVTGGKIRNPGNYIVRIGTSVKDIIAHCGFVSDDNSVIKLGGPMMGVAIDGIDVPVTKGTNGIIAITQANSAPSPCIRCGRCVDVCPMELLPLYYPQYAGSENRDGMNEKSVMDCIECGCCDFICPSKIAIREAIRLGKNELRDQER